MKTATMTTTARKPSTDRQSITDAIEVARMRPGLLNDYEASLLKGVEALGRNGREPSEKQTRAVLAIAHRVAGGETRKPAPVAQTPAPAPAPAATPTVKPERIKGQTREASRKYGTKLEATDLIPKAEPFEKNARVIHDKYGFGVVFESDDEKTIFQVPAKGQEPGPMLYRVLTVALRAV